VDGSNLIYDKKALLQLPAPQEVLRQLLQTFHFTPEQARQAAVHLSETGLQWTSEKYRLLLERDALRIQLSDGAEPVVALSIGADDLMVRLPEGGTLFFMGATPAPPFPDGKNAVLVDANRLKYPLVLRHWQSGDRFQPFGMKGQSQSVQDFFTNQKTERAEKEKIRILINGDGEIIWIVGHRADDRFKITPHTTSGILIRWIM
jgi:tRNA(Ile)-lysidine synthase